MRRQAIALVFLAFVATPALALSNRAFVKSTGMDVGACALATPCRSFAYAITQVAASGEVIALDTAGYGPFVVTQSVSVFAAPGVTAFIAVNSGTGILIDSPVSSSDVIILRGLALTGTGGSFGIQFFAGHSLAIENCVINGFSSFAVGFDRTGDNTSPFVRIDHSTIRNNNGISIENDLSPVGLTVSNSLFTNAFVAIFAGNYARVVVTDTTLAGGSVALNAQGNFTGLGVAQIDAERCTISGNVYGVTAGNPLVVPQNTTSIVRLAHNVITGNTVGVLEYPNGVIMTMMSAGTATNTIEGNGTDGTMSGTYTAR